MPLKEIPNSYITELPDDRHSFDVDAFDQAIRSQGVTFLHWRAMRCPVGMIDAYDQRRPNDCHMGCSNGFIYTEAGKITCLFLGNSMSTSPQETGLLDAATVQSTIPRFYDGSEEPLYIAPFDRLYLTNENILVTNWQMYEHSVSGRDKLSFPVEKVQDLMDNRGIRYRAGQDFEVRGGVLVWGSNRPGLDPETGKGRICSARYLYRPFFYVKQMIHELRVTQVTDPVTGRRSLESMPQTVLLQREYVFDGKEARDDQAPDPNSLRQARAPEGGDFGAR